jgi:hypothetical protein
MKISEEDKAHADNYRLRAENARLEEDNVWLIARYDKLNDELIALHAENDRLRDLFNRAIGVLRNIEYNTNGEIANGLADVLSAALTKLPTGEK